MIDKKHILITCSRLDVPGGIERAVVNAANLFVEKGHYVSLLVLDKQRGSFYPIAHAVTILYNPLDFGVGEDGNVVTRKLRLARHLLRLKGIIRNIEPDLIIASDYVHAIALKIVVSKSIDLVSWEHHHFNQLKKNTFWTFLFRRFYPRLNWVVCLNEDEAIFYNSIGCTVAVIPNFIEQNENQTRLTNQQLLTIGWLTHTKGADFILKVAALVFKVHPEWTWRVIGSGDSLKDQMQNIQVVEPCSPDIIAEYLSSSVYILPSRFECFPMVLLEAMSVGLPCVAFNCPTGPRHIIKHNEDGILVENGSIQQMADSIIELINDAEKRKALGNNAWRNVHRFSPDTVYELWERVLQAE